MAVISQALARVRVGAQTLAHVAATLWADLPARRHFTRIFLWQAGVVLVLSAAVLGLSSSPSGTLRLGDRPKPAVEKLDIGPLHVVKQGDGDLYVGDTRVTEPPEEPAPTGWAAAWAWVLKAWTTVFTLQLLVVALTRDFYEGVERRLASQLGQPVERGPLRRPRIRLDWGWLKRRAQRRIWMFWPLLVVGLLSAPLAVIPLVGGKLTSALASVTTAWLFVVGTAAKTGRGWDDEFDRDAAFIAVPLARLRWVPARWFARLWRWSWKRLKRPAAAASSRPAELSGLALARLVGLVPLAGLLLRPLVPVAATELLRPAVQPAVEPPVVEALPEPVEAVTVPVLPEPVAVALSAPSPQPSPPRGGEGATASRR
ncbi:MAG: hypothetical protein IPJ65_38810 [Archangiaceae bacterium]|nr:hypothetical protein [Archangiaceae bacterium]